MADYCIPITNDDDGLLWFTTYRVGLQYPNYMERDNDRRNVSALLVHCQDEDANGQQDELRTHFIQNVVFSLSTPFFQPEEHPKIDV